MRPHTFEKTAAIVITVDSTTCVIARRVKVAATFKDRLTGLLRHRSLDDDAGIWLLPCASVHTVGMRFAIDIVFLDKSLVVRKIVANVTAWRICLAPPRTHSVLELVNGRAATTGLKVGDRLSLKFTEESSERPKRRYKNAA